MAYNVGDKFVIEIKERMAIQNKIDEYVYKTTDNGINSAEILDSLPPLVGGVEQYSYNKGMEDAWELARCIFNMENDDLEALFIDGLDVAAWNVGTILKNYTVQTAKKILKDWDNKIKVGDEVEFFSCKGVVVAVGDNGIYVRVIRKNGWSETVEIERCTKTGNNYATELRELLDKIGGESE